jgi:hypothetical protein
LADINADIDVVEFVRRFPAEQRQVVGLTSCVLHVEMAEISRVIVDKVFKDETVWRNNQNLGETSSTIVDKPDEFRRTRERLAIHICKDSNFLMSNRLTKKSDDETLASVRLAFVLQHCG